jgi:hypothetical protein
VPVPDNLPRTYGYGNGFTQISQFQNIRHPTCHLPCSLYVLLGHLIPLALSDLLQRHTSYILRLLHGLVYLFVYTHLSIPIFLFQPAQTACCGTSCSMGSTSCCCDVEPAPQTIDGPCMRSANCEAGTADIMISNTNYSKHLARSYKNLTRNSSASQIAPFPLFPAFSISASAPDKIPIATI